MAKGVKTGGRQKGTPNKRSQKLAEIFIESKLDVPKELALELMTMEPGAERAKHLIACLPYLFPKLANISVDFKPEDLDDASLLDEAKAAIAYLESKGKSNE